MLGAFLRIIAALEIIGGFFGLLFVIQQASVTILNSYLLVLFCIVSVIYALSIFGGYGLWNRRPYGRSLSIIIQIIQVPKIVSRWLVLMFSFGIDAYPYLTFSSESVGVGFDVKLLAFYQILMNTKMELWGVGVSIPACISLLILIQSKPYGHVYKPDEPVRSAEIERQD